MKTLAQPVFLLLLAAAAPVLGQAWTGMAGPLTGNPFSFNTGTGHGWLDIDGDGDFDLVLNGNKEFWINKTLENGSFESMSGLLPGGLLSSKGWSVAVGDFDNDGDPDLHLGNQSNDYLLENRWPDPFVDRATDLALLGEFFNQSVNWVDYNRDGLLDIYITHERPDVDGAHRFYESAYPAAFTPRFPAMPGDPDPFGLADRNSHAYGLSWADIDIDGDIDAVTSACGLADVIPNENPHNKIYRNMFPDDRFEDLSLATGLVTPGEVQTGSESYWALLFDYNGDPFPDLFIGSSLLGGPHRLWRNTGVDPGDFGIELVDPLVHDMTGQRAFIDGACAGDFDNDGDLDIYITCEGLFQNNGDGSFTRRTDLVGRSTLPSRGDASFVDFDLDGDLDLFNFQDLYRNPGNENHFLAVELSGDPAANTTRSAHNVKIRVRAGGVDQHREHRFMVGAYSQHMLPTHFGLGLNETVEELEVQWFDGTTAQFADIPADQYLYLTQGADCSGALQNNGQAFYRYCLGDSIALAGAASGGAPLQWRVVEGADRRPTQFDDAAMATATFTPSRTGFYTLRLYYQGCPQSIQVRLYDTDYNGDGVYDLADAAAAAPLWGRTDDIEPYDLDSDGLITMLDLLGGCAL